MSIATRATRLRWAAATAVLVVVASVPTLATTTQNIALGLGDHPLTRSSAAAQLKRALDSAKVGFSGLSESRGTLGLPDFAALGDVSSLLSSTTRTRVWWASATAWRVDTLTAGGEHGTYAAPGDPRHSVITWNYASSALTTVHLADDTSVNDIARLPRADDLIPPALGRRLLAGVSADDAVSIGTARPLAGRRTSVLRVRPADSRSTIGLLQVRLDSATALPLQVDVRNRQGQLVFTSSFDSVSMQTPPLSVLQPPDPPDARRSETDTPDLAARASRRVDADLPRSLAGFAANRRLGGAASYGSGFIRFVVVPVAPRTSRELVKALEGRSLTVKLRNGSTHVVSASLLNAVLVTNDDGGLGYVLAGAVTADVLNGAGQDLLLRPRGFG